MLLPIYIYGHPILRKVSEDITPEYEGLSKLLDDMWQTMYESDCKRDDNRQNHTESGP